MGSGLGCAGLLRLGSWCGIAEGVGGDAVVEEVLGEAVLEVVGLDSDVGRGEVGVEEVSVLLDRGLGGWVRSLGGGVDLGGIFTKSACQSLRRT